MVQEEQDGRRRKRDRGDAHTLSELKIVTLDSWVLILTMYRPASHLYFVHVQNGMVQKQSVQKNKCLFSLVILIIEINCIGC